MKKNTAMLMALSFTVLSLAGCSSNEDEPLSSGIFTESEVFVTTAPTMPEETTSAEEEIIHKKANSMEELLIGVANAIGSHNEDEFNSYISKSNRNHNLYSYKAIHKKFIEALNNAGLDFKKTYTYEDFCFFKYDNGKSYDFMLIESPDDVRFDLGQFSYGYDLENDEYFILSVSFTPIKGRYERALKRDEQLDLSAYAPEEVTE